jgi:hypothetical protein
MPKKLIFMTTAIRISSLTTKTRQQIPSVCPKKIPEIFRTSEDETWHVEGNGWICGDQIPVSPHQ